MSRRLIATPGEQLVAPLLALPNSGCASVCPRPLVVSRIDHHAHILAFAFTLITRLMYPRQQILEFDLI